MYVCMRACIYLCTYLSVCICMCIYIKCLMCTGLRRSEEGIGFLGTRITAICELLMWVWELNTKGSSTLNCWTISVAPELFYLLAYFCCYHEPNPGP